ncbi:hypothetical protein Tco_0928673 [Tanacetum coccineum]
MLDVALVPSNEQVKIAVCNFRIALEKIQPNVIYKVCLEILKRYSFYNVVIATTDAPEIYMQQFWYTITYDLTAQAYFFTMGDQEFKVNVDVLRNALSTTPKVLDHPFTLPDPEKEIIKFINELRWKDTAYVSLRLPVLQLLWGMVTCSNVDFTELIWEEFKYQIKSRKVSKQKQELMPYPRFTKLIVKYIMSKNDQISKRPLSFQHIIKLDTTLGNLKFANKGTKDPIFGMSIPAIMLNDEIKASAEYSEYLAKSKGSAPIKATGRGKGLLTKQGVEIAVERVSTPKRGWSKTSEGSGITLEIPDELVFKSLNEGAGVTPKVPDKSSNGASRSSSDSEFIVEDISSEEAEDSKKTDC